MFRQWQRFSSFAACLLLAPLMSACGTPYEGESREGDRPKAIAGLKYVEGEKGDPKVIGCADGQREGFADAKTNPRIAGCAGSWTGPKSLRDRPTGKACGDDGDTCAVPADACAEGWHVCGAAGSAKDVRDHTTAKRCHEAGPGRFNAAMSHGQTDELCPPKPTPATVFPCTQAGVGSESVCCGNDCAFGRCRDGVWPGKTKISKGLSEGCGAVSADRNGGVLCCFDGAGNPGEPVGGVKAADAEAADSKAPDAKAADGKAPDAKAADGKAPDANAADAKAG